MIFSRRRGTAGRHARPQDRRSGPRHAASRAESTDELADGELGAGSPEDADDRLLTRAPGPYDISEAPRNVPRLDLGSLQIPAVDGVEVRVQASPDGTIQQVFLVHGESALQLAVVAAPRTEGIWEEVRAELRKSLFAEGVAAEEVDGAYGPELRARVRSPEGLTDLRMIGVDGPRWMVRAVYQGPAAVDPGAAGPLAECLTGLVVDRGIEAMPVQEPLPLRLPKEAGVEAEPAGSAAPAGSIAPAGPTTPAPSAPSPAATTQPGATPPAATPPGASPRRKPSPRPRRRH